MRTSGDPDGLFLMSDSLAALSALFFKGLFDLRFSIPSQVNETTEQFRAKFILPKFSRG